MILILRGVKKGIAKHLDNLSKLPLVDGKAPIEIPTETTTDSDDDGTSDVDEVKNGSDPQQGPQDSQDPGEGEGTNNSLIQIENIATNQTYTYSDNAIVPLTFTNVATNGVMITNCSSTPTLPNGLSVAVNGNACQITGTPRSVSSEVYTITASDGGNNSDVVTIRIEIDPRVISVTATAQTIIYQNNAPLPTLSYTHTVLLAGDSFTGSLSAGTTIGIHPIGQGSLTAGDNYDIVFNSAILTIQPVAPTTLTATANTDGSVDLAWSLNTGTVDTGRVRIYYDTEPLVIDDINNNVIGHQMSVLDTTTTASITGLTAGTEYYFIVSSFINDINSNVSNEVFVTTAISTQAIQINNIADQTYVYGDAITPLNFINMGTMAIASCSIAPNLPTGLSVVTGNTCQITGTPTGINATTTYTMTASAGNGGSDTATVRINVNPRVITVTANTQAITYTEYENNEPLSYTYTDLVTGDTLNFTGGLEATTTGTNIGIGVYTIALGSLAIDNNNYIIDFASATLTIQPDAPTNLAIMTNNDGSVALTWDATTTGRVDIHYATEPFTGLTDINNDNYNILQDYGNTTTALITGLTAGTKYYFIVRSVINEISSDVNNQVSATITISAQTTTSRLNLNNTGITWSGADSNSNTDLTGQEEKDWCDSGLIVGAQDCSHGRDRQALDSELTKIDGGPAGFDFTKLGQDGTPLTIQTATYTTDSSGTEATGTKWSCVRDNVTGLVWEVKEAENTGSGIHDETKRYRWGGLTAIGRDSTADDKPNTDLLTYFDDWNELVTGTNGEALCGFTNWRVPSRIELFSIFNKGELNQSIDYFPYKRPTDLNLNLWWWSSYPSSVSGGVAWSINFGDGSNQDYATGTRNPVRLVRSSEDKQALAPSSLAPVRLVRSSEE